MNIFILYNLVLACFLSWATTPWIKKLALKVGATDAPNARKVHTKTMPRLGGVAIYIGFVLTVLSTQDLNREILGLLIGCTVILLVGILDDIYGLSPKLKFLGQFIAALVLIAFGYKVRFVTHPWEAGTIIDLEYLAIPFTILWIIGVTNAVNLIDGLDGLAAGTSAIAAITMALVGFTSGQAVAASLALILAASILGFLRYNFHPAQIFMGDCGSLFLGYALGALAISGLTKGATVISLFIPVVILGIPIMDTLFAIVRRFSNGRPIFQPDKKHLHHCLLELGLSHKGTVLVIYFIDACLGASAVVLSKLSTYQSYVVLIILATLVIVGANKIGVLSLSNSTTVSKIETGKAKLRG